MYGPTLSIEDNGIHKISIQSEVVKDISFQNILNWHISYFELNLARSRRTSDLSFPIGNTFNNLGGRTALHIQWGKDDISYQRMVFGAGMS